MKKYLTAPPAAVLFLLLAAGCTKQPLNNLNDAESRIYITNHDSTVVFSNFKSFSITDSVAVISNNRLQQKSRTTLDSLYIAAAANAMQQRGYTRVAKGQNPDLGISINRIYNSYTGVVSYPDYWGGYYGYWDPYYWGYPGYSYYASYVGVYQINEGALSVDMFDLKDAAANKDLKSVWSGLVRGYGIFVPDNAAAEVKALFDQSTYIATH